jgi:hypothetical protein
LNAQWLSGISQGVNAALLWEEINCALKSLSLSTSTRACQAVAQLVKCYLHRHEGAIPHVLLIRCMACQDNLKASSDNKCVLGLGNALSLYYQRVVGYTESVDYKG